MKKLIALSLFGTTLAMPSFAQQLICFTSYVSAFDFFSPINQLPDRELLITTTDKEHTLTIFSGGQAGSVTACTLDRSTSYLFRFYCKDETVILDYPDLNEGKIVPHADFADQKLVCRDLSKLSPMPMH